MTTELTTEQLHNIGRLLSSDEPANVELGKQILKGSGRFDWSGIDSCFEGGVQSSKIPTSMILDDEIFEIFMMSEMLPF